MSDPREEARSALAVKWTTSVWTGVKVAGGVLTMCTALASALVALQSFDKETLIGMMTGVGSAFVASFVVAEVGRLRCIQSALKEVMQSDKRYEALLSERDEKYAELEKQRLSLEVTNEVLRASNAELQHHVIALRPVPKSESKTYKKSS